MPPKKAKTTSSPSANLVQKFKDLKLHTNDEEEDYDEQPFILSATVQTEHKSSNYGCAFNPYADDPNEDQLVATVGGEYLHVFHCPPETNHLVPLKAWHFPTDNQPKEGGKQLTEQLFSVSWAADSYEDRNGRSELRLVAGGQLGKLYVVDYGTMAHCNTLHCTGGEINEIRVSPANSDLIAVASSDMALRIFHIRNSACLVVIGGPKCHQGNILTVDWHYKGDYIISAGIDHRAIRWDLAAPPVKKHIDRICEALKSGEQNQFEPVQPTNDKELEAAYAKSQQHPGGAKASSTRSTFQTQWPNDIHFNAVDCVRVLSGVDRIMSKSVDSTLTLWRFGPPMHQQVNPVPQRIDAPETCTTVLQTRDLGDADPPFFIKFDIDPRRRWIACPGREGSVSFYDMRNPKPEIRAPQLLSSCTNPNAQG
ncbi:hypothetical protein CAEBREN_29779 [Caenorhabditis brenneri]|uniref:Uncharacterized protein n=1 Tax=Caenorhabditis brenneri TaxID=135651 RepID=G0PJ31_CAEBE|nr:hypothetical protein CAEBREN_29779 [Caenorhabditis brenneri]